MKKYYISLNYQYTISTIKQRKFTRKGKVYMSIFIVSEQSETISSLQVAKMIDKKHYQLLKDIRRYINQIEKSNLNSFNHSKVTNYFIETNFTDTNGKEQTYYNITRSGCDYIANRLMDQKKAFRFKTRYNDIFRLRNIINNINLIFDSIYENGN